MRRIKCSNPNCNNTFGHLLGNKTLDLGRKQQHFTLIGGDFSFIGTCGKCGEKTTVFAENGAIVDDELEFQDDGALTEEQQAQLEADQLRHREEETDTEADALKPKPKEDDELDEEGNPKPKSHLEPKPVTITLTPTPDDKD